MFYKNSGYGLSCIENYFLHMIANQDTKYSYLFYQSYISFEEAFFEIFENKSTYANWKATPRIHITAENNDIALYKWNKSNTLYLMNSWHTAIRIKPEYIKNRYNISSWRNDHYIFVDFYNDNCYSYINDVPPDEGVLNKNILEEAYDGEIFRFKFVKQITSELVIRWKNELLNNLSKDAFCLIN